jgi:hypothetical protein
VLDNVVPICPDCHADLAFVCSWPARGPWGYNEIQTYECPAHGPMFISAEPSVRTEPTGRTVKGPDDDDRDSLALARRKPKPGPNADAVAVPEPDSEPDSN